jgi:RNA polymerase subunit RPABC4/transcription elongation factor Spt4
MQEGIVHMTAPTRMPRYNFSNDGMGPYAIFYCDRDGREYRSNPAITTTIKENVTRGALGGFLRNVPIIGDSAANQIENDRYRSDMTSEELNTAWAAVAQYFRECPTCHQIVCIPDFDEVTGFCDEDSPRAAEVEAAKAQQAAAALKGVADVFGIGGAIQRSMANAQAAGAPAAAGFTTACLSCGTPLAPGTKFCANCGTPVAQPSTCKSCGTQLAAGAKFCPNCGTPATA